MNFRSSYMHSHGIDFVVRNVEATLGGKVSVEQPLIKA